MDKYFYPIPKEKLIARFAPVFGQFKKSRNSTLLALPYAGRSSHLRFISSQPELQKELDISNRDKLVWSETESCSNFIQLISQICVSIDPESVNHPSILSRDTYLVQLLLKSIIRSQGQIIVIISLGRLNYLLVPDVELLFTLLQKECPNLKILWSIDIVVFRNYSPKHASCNILESVYCFPTFSKNETTHSLKRIANTRQKHLSKLFDDSSLDLTGGLAGLFHLFIFQGESYLSLPQAGEIIKLVSQELTLSPELSIYLTTPELRQFLVAKQNNSHTFRNLKLSQPPTAQEIGMLNLFLEKENKNVTRDEIAQVLWGKLWQEKYSDWALDKSISRLRSNLISKTHQLITVKGLGYSLICPQN